MSFLQTEVNHNNKLFLILVIIPLRLKMFQKVLGSKRVVSLTKFTKARRSKVGRGDAISDK